MPTAYGNLRDYPLDDDYSVIRQIGEMLPFADTTRVGIYGHSGGGFMTATAMMTRPDFYKAGVAASATTTTTYTRSGGARHSTGFPKGNRRTARWSSSVTCRGPANLPET